MIAIGNVFVSEELLEETFACNLNACKGACCISGEGGAPLEYEELDILDKIKKAVAPYLSKEGKKVLKEKGNWTAENYFGEIQYATPLHSYQGPCAYVVIENGIALCGIEKAWRAGAIDFQKPISCHLYPIRVDIMKNGMEVLNYHRWSVCSPACENGKALKMPVYRFLKDAIVRKYGLEFYEALDAIAQAMPPR